MRKYKSKLKVDFLGEPTNIGDYVIFIPKGYRHLATAKVINVTPTGFRLIYWNTWNYPKPGNLETIYQMPQQVVNITGREDQALAITLTAEGARIDMEFLERKRQSQKKWKEAQKLVDKKNAVFRETGSYSTEEAEDA